MPIINTPVASREEPYDRNPSTGVTGFGILVAEAEAATDRWTYTVPANTKAMVGSITLEMMATVAGTSSSATATAILDIQVQPAGGSFSQILRGILLVPNLVVGRPEYVPIGAGTFLVEGDAIKMVTTFDGTGGGAGRVNMTAAVWRMEFDA